MKALTPWSRALSPWEELDKMQERVNRVFGLTTPTFFGEEPLGWKPNVNLKEEDGEYLLTAELPGLELKDIEVDVDRDNLTLKGEKKTEFEERKEGRWHICERSYGSFERSFTLPRAVEADKVKASFDNGILTVHLPKRKEAMGRKIEISKK
ncbi:MAG: Hsp20/alpha crystallin family protein [Gemmatimonadales bacterium]|nr:MAG: Hsp20/alpha crystallin family protein [Gemmatimonadales bacterium]